MENQTAVVTEVAENTTTVNEMSFDFNGTGIRCEIIEGEPWFVAKDICDILGYANTSKAVSDHTYEEDRYNDSLERGGKLIYINESGLYGLIMRSNKPEAKQFQRWVTKEVLPSIRKTGSYSANAEPQRTLIKKELPDAVHFAIHTAISELEIIGYALDAINKIKGTNDLSSMVSAINSCKNGLKKYTPELNFIDERTKKYT